MELLPFLSIFGFIRFLKAKTSLDEFYLPAASITFIILCLYTCALFSILNLAAFTLLAVGLALLLGFTARDLSKGKFRFAWESRCFLAFFLAGALFYGLFLNSWFTGWDEFSHWGYVIKEIMATGSLPSPNSPISFTDYPPGGNLLHHYFLLPGGFREGGAYFSQAILVFAFILPVFASSSRLSPVKFAAWMIFFILSLEVFFEWKSLYVDQFLGAVFGSSLILSWHALYKSPHKALLTGMICLISVIKPITILFSLVVLGCHGIGLLITRKSNNTVKTRLLFLVFAVLALVLFYLSWKWHLKSEGFAPRPSNLSISEVFTSFSGERIERDLATLQNFLKKFMSRTFWFIVLIPTLSFLVSKKSRLLNNLKTKKFLGYQAGLGFFFACYAFTLFVLYLYFFSEYEGTRLASYKRYTKSFEFGWFLFSSHFFLRAAAASKVPPFAKKAIIGVVSLLVLIESKAGFSLFKNVWEKPDIRKKTHRDASLLHQHLNSGSRVYIVWQHSKGLPLWMSKYELHPAITNEKCWTLGSPFQKNDQWSCDWSLRKFAEVLKKYDYLYIGRADSSFWSRYGKIFNKKADTGFYKLKPEDETKARLLVELEPVPENTRN